MCMILSAHLHTENMHIVLETHIYTSYDFSRMTTLILKISENKTLLSNYLNYELMF